MKLTAIFCSFALAAVCVSQDAPAAKPKTQPLVLEAGEIQLPDFINSCAMHLGWNILWTPQELASTQSFRLQHRIEVAGTGCEDLLTTILSRSSLAVTPLDETKKLYEVISVVGPRAREITARAPTRTPEEVLARPNLKVPVTVVFKLQHVNATIATNALRPFFASTSGPTSGTLTIGNVGNQSAMLLAGMQDQVAAALKLLQTCDVPPAPDLVPTNVERIEALERRVQELEKKLNPQQGK